MWYVGKRIRVSSTRCTKVGSGTWRQGRGEIATRKLGLGWTVCGLLKTDQGGVRGVQVLEGHSNGKGYLGARPTGEKRRGNCG